MEVNAESIHGTTATPFGKPKWGRYTKKPERIYAHIFQWPETGILNIPAEDIQATRAYLLADEKQSDLKIEQKQNGLIVHLPRKAPEAIASVVVIEHKEIE